MKEHGILMKPDLAQAAYDGLKNQTRRIVGHGAEWGTPADLDDLSKYGLSQMRHCCPYGKPGDLIYIKEVHYAFGLWQGDGHTKTERQKWRFEDWTHESKPVLFPYNKPKHVCTKKSDFGYFKRNSLFMPKRYARTWSRIKDIRVERLLDISVEDAIAEGYTNPDFSKLPLEWFTDLWDSINADRGFGWKSNPWVWVIEFERIDHHG